MTNHINNLALTVARLKDRQPKPVEIPVSDLPSEEQAYQEHRRRFLHCQRCGGGFRVLRKRVGGD